MHEGGASRPRPDHLPLLALSRVRYAEKHHGMRGARGFSGPGSCSSPPSALSFRRILSACREPADDRDTPRLAAGHAASD